MQHGFGDKLRGDAAQQTSDGGRDLEHHAEAQIDQLIAGTSRSHRRRSRNDRGQADRRRRFQRETERERQERNEKDSATKAERNTERAGHGARGEDDQCESRSEVQGAEPNAPIEPREPNEPYRKCARDHCDRAVVIARTHPPTGTSAAGELGGGRSQSTAAAMASPSRQDCIHCRGRAGWRQTWRRRIIMARQP